MACIITYNNRKYTQPEFNEYFKSHFFEFAGDFLGSKQDVEGFRHFNYQNNEKYLLESEKPFQEVKPEITEEDINNLPSCI